MEKAPNRIPETGKPASRTQRNFGWRYLIAVAFGAMAAVSYLCLRQANGLAKHGEIAQYPYFYPACLIAGILSGILVLILFALNLRLLKPYSGASRKAMIIFIELLLASVSFALSWTPIALALFMAM